MYAPLVSIVIPAYNASNYLANAIDSALAQTYSNIEIIVVNDGSQDDGATRRVALSYKDKIRYVEKENGGSSSALNVGIQEMQGEWFSWLSHDDLYYPEKIAKQIEYINETIKQEEKLEDYVLFGAEDLIDVSGKYIRRTKQRKSEKKAKIINSIVDNCFLIAEGGSRYCFNGCSCLIHKSVFQKVGTFDEQLRLLNDVDMWKRIFKANYKIRYIADPIVMQRIHAKQISASIGFSYHNPEQDAYWQDSLQWLISRHSCELCSREAIYFFGCSAYRKTRKEEGDKAFNYIKLHGGKKFFLSCKKFQIIVISKILIFLKKIYLKIRL